MTIPKASLPAVFHSRFIPAVVFTLFLVLTLGSPAGAFAAAKKSEHDAPYALIYGTVWGPDNRPVYGAKVKIRRGDQKKAKWELYSDHSGEFAQRVPAGAADYVIWTEVKGKAPDGKHLDLHAETKVHVDNDEREDVGLHLK